MSRPASTLLFGYLLVGSAHAMTVEVATTVFTEYQTLQLAFDPAFADLYCDSIVSHRVV